VSLTGPPKPTFLYPRIKFSSPAITIDPAEPTSRIPTITPYTGLRGVNTVASGRTEYLFGRPEEQVGLVLRCEQDQLAALRWFVQDFAARGNQFNAWVDRYTGSCWVFENNRKDQNGFALTLNGGGIETYVATTNGTGIVLSGAQYLTAALAQASASTPTGYDDPMLKSEGVLVVDFKPAFTSTDGVEHYMVTGGPNGVNSWSLFKNTSNELVWQIVDGTNTAKNRYFSPAPTWTTGDRLQIVALWTAAGVLEHYAAVNSGAWSTAGSASGAGTGILGTLPTTLGIGALITGASLAPGTYDTVAFFKKAFANPQLSLANFRPIERNHYPYAELTAAAFQPARVTLGRPIWDWPIMFRNGVIG
jgi:hypothetical protein